MMGPTAAILSVAQKAPGGVIRWKEARDAYLKHSAAAKRDEAKANRKASKGSRNGNCQYHIALKRVLDRHFSKVQGTDGFYVLDHLIVGDTEGDELAVDLYELEREDGS